MLATMDMEKLDQGELKLGIFKLHDLYARFFAADDGDRQEFAKTAKRLIRQRLKAMPRLESKIAHLPVAHIVAEEVESILDKVAGVCPEPSRLVFAPTQAGKSAYKAIILTCYLTFNAPCLLITKGQQESKELMGKISYYFKGSEFHDRVWSIYDENRWKNCHRDVDQAFALVTPDTYQKYAEAGELLSKTMRLSQLLKMRSVGTAILLDECDVIEDRSRDGNQRNEKAIKTLIDCFHPSTFKITATPIPTIFKNSIAPTDDETSRKIRVLSPPQKYVGVQNFRAPRLGINGVEGDWYLDPDTLQEGFVVHDFKANYTCEKPLASAKLFAGDRDQYRAKFPQGKKTKLVIPWWNEESNRLLEMEFEAKRPGLLMLVGTATYVTAKDNIFEQAAWVQDLFFHSGKPFVAIAIHSDRLYYRLPGHKYAFKCERKVDFATLLNRIDQKLGLEMAVVVFGYRALKRSRSLRSDKRVPTSMVLYHREGQSNENLRQAAGRATFTGEDVLVRNRGTDKPLFLCPEDDFSYIQQYDKVVEAMLKPYEEGRSWEEIKEFLPPNLDLLDRSGRKFGLWGQVSAHEETLRSSRAAQGTTVVAVNDEIGPASSHIPEEGGDSGAEDSVNDDGAALYPVEDLVGGVIDKKRKNDQADSDHDSIESSSKKAKMV